jgi:CRP/FNR family cyclic AMP-dependent transcriptional regulator
MTPKELKILTEIRSMELFNDLDPAHLHKLVSIATEANFSPGEIIYEEGEVGRAIYLVQEGEVTIEMVLSDRMVTLFTVGAGHLFGWSSLFAERRKQARARVTEPTRAITIDAAQLRDLFRSDHQLERVIMHRMTQVIAERVYSARLQLAKALS